MDYDIKLDTLTSKQSEFETLKSSAEDIYNEFNSCYLSRIYDSEISGIKNGLKEPISRLKNGYTNSNSWLKDYVKELGELEDNLAAFNVADLNEITEFKGEFVDLFGKKTMPIIKTGGDIHANSTRAIIHNSENLIVSSSSGYVFPFEIGVRAPITSHVGLRTDPINGSANAHHNGTDIGVAYGTPIHAIQGGTVINAGRGDAGGFGNWVRIRQDDGNVVIYGHVSKSDYFSVGSRVEAGDVIANIGSEGRSTGPHLHLEMHDANGNLLDSENYFSDCWPG